MTYVIKCLRVLGSRVCDGKSAVTIQGEAQFWWRDLVRALPAAIYTTDARGRITFYNDAAAELWGSHPEIGKSEWCGSWKLYWPDGTPLPHDECPMAVALKTGRAVRGVEAVAERPDGTRVPFMPYPTPLFDASGKLVGAVNMLVDLTDRVHAEEVAQHLASIVESSDDAIVSKDLNGIITSWNSGAARLFGYTDDEVIGKSVTILIPPERHNEEPDILARIQRGERVDHYETFRRRKDGSHVAISLTVSPVRDAKGRITGASKIARDITERRQAEARQQLLTRELHHRTQNIFSVVQAVVSKSFAGKRTVEEARTAVLDRLHSLARTHALLVEKDWLGSDLLDLVRSEMRPFTDRVVMSGPTVVLSPQAAQSFALAVHELATNAVKHGALSSPHGRVIIRWSVAKPNGSSQFTFHWQERDGPPTQPPTHRGFGSIVLEQVMAEYFEARSKIDFAASGVSYQVEGPLDAIAAVPDVAVDTGRQGNVPPPSAPSAA